MRKLNPKSETLNSKQIQMSQILKSKTRKFKTLRFRNCDLFRISSLVFSIFIFSIFLSCMCSAQNGDLEFTLDINSDTIPLPAIFKPNIDLSGRGFHRDTLWPQTMAAKEVLDTWQKDIGFSAVYRLQYNLWDIHQLAKDKNLQNNLLTNYENIIKRINDSGGLVILDIFGTPAGLGKVLDKKSPPLNLKAFKEIVKNTMREFSCNKKYNVWYEVWNAPDLDAFFLGRKAEYFNLYRTVAQAKRELEDETKIHIPLGAPAVSWWFQNLDANSIATPENSLIYEFIKFCYHYHLPLDFISWHGYSTDPAAEKESTIYKKSAVTLIRDWLSYFDFDRNTPLFVDEWNFDRNANMLAERQEKSNICASFIPSRIENMYEAGIDNQVYFSLEDFQNNKEGLVRNVGIFSYDSEHSEYKGNPKAIYNAFRMLNNLGGRLYQARLTDEFAGVIATKNEDNIIILVYNYIDPEIVTNYLSRNIGTLNSSGRKILIRIIKSQNWPKFLEGQIDVAGLRAKKKVQGLLTEARRLGDLAKKFSSSERKLKLSIKNLKENYTYSKYVVDSSCSRNCEFAPAEEKELNAPETYQEELILKPYSVQMIILKKKPKEPEAAPAAGEQPETEKSQ